MKKLIIVILCFFSFHSGFCQHFTRFTHGVGAGVLVTSANQLAKTVAPAFTYSPRLYIKQDEKKSISIGLPMTIAYADDYKRETNREGPKQSSYLVNVPVMINFNHGAGSSNVNRKRAGIFFGAGFGATFGRFITKSYYPVNETVFGPAGNIGLRFRVGKAAKNIEAKVSYNMAVTGNKASVLGLAALFNL